MPSAVIHPERSQPAMHLAVQLAHQRSVQPGPLVLGPDPLKCPTLPQGPPCSTIGAVRLSFRVRNVTGRFPHAMTTETL